jgi:hypothetical protein
MRSHFDERLSDRSTTERSNTYYIGLWNSSERFLNRKKALCNNIERQRTGSFKLGNILFLDEPIH